MSSEPSFELTVVPETATAAKPPGPGFAALWPWFGGIAVTGVPLGLLWWLLAPGGAWWGNGSDPLQWAARDAVLGSLVLAAGIVSGLLVLRARHRPGSWRFLLAAVAGSALGAVTAWLLGSFAGALWGTEASGASGSVGEWVAFGLRTPNFLLFWPLATSAVFFLALTVETIFRPAAPVPRNPEAEAGSDHGTDPGQGAKPGRETRIG
ncbi:hypothetical protein ODZ83_05070 [Acaricomes phytoseiuli]|uniref:hypothetical protein n=1 Tax=Acaricomes phytoseiuli TaxID=291968 RepID=UPI0003706823|nr:hypothetical protein [Acaricomes phytoseiuli]MCW1249563.1 hypothetical protein [Acaricomes phytoseiuli]